MNRFKVRKLAVCTAIALFSLQAAAESIDIEEQPLSGALLEFSQQTGLQLAYVATWARNKTSPGTQGKTKPGAALSDILQGTQLEYQYVNNATVAIGPSRVVVDGQSSPDGGKAAPEPILMAQVQDERRQADQGDEGDEGDEEDDVDDDSPLELQNQVVTGTRLTRGDPTTRVLSLSAEDIAQRGVASTEDLMRTLPWNFASVTTQNNTRLDDLDTNENALDGLALGTSTVNLRNLGSANTLVLINGRRLASRAGEEDSLVNILTLPLSAIERVDIQLDGASAVYGSDAIGGVVNFITKKNYRGLSATVRNEFSSTDADNFNISLLGGYAWYSGSVTATLSRQTRKPINNHKLWISSDYRHLFGPEFDARSDRSGQPGVVREYCGDEYWGYPCGPKYQLPAGHSGMGATFEDFGTDIALVDRIIPYSGEDSTSESLSVSLEQYVSDSFRLYADGLFSKVNSYQEWWSEMRDWVVPASNAYNPFGQTVSVSYWPQAEIDSGTLSPPFFEAENELRDFSVGFQWDFWDNEKLELNATRSRADRFGRELYYIWTDNLDFSDPTIGRIQAALASSDPNTALNLFGDGSAQGTGLGELFSTPGTEDGVSITTAYEPVLRGQLLDLWGGPLAYVVGAEFRKETSYLRITSYAQDGTLSDTSSSYEVLSIGLEEPTRKLTAYFAEFSIPIVGADNDRPGLRELTLSLKGRRDTYTATGAAGGVQFDYLVGDFVGEPNLVTAKKSANSPWLGLSYKPADSFAVRANWSRAFRPPVYTDMFDRENLPEEPSCTYLLSDPYDPDGGSGCVPILYVSANLELDSEFSNSYSLGFEWTPDTLPGLRWTVDWSLIDFENQIRNSFFLLIEHPEIGFRIPDLVERDADGRLIAAYTRNINFAESVNETLDTTLEFRFDSRWGTFTPRLNYTRVLDEYFKVGPGFEEVSGLGTLVGSDKYNITGHLTWESGRIAADMFLRYTPSYINGDTGECREEVGRCMYEGADRPDLDVGSFLTVDLTVSYSFDNGVRLRAGGRNVLDADPPRTVAGRRQPLPYDSIRYDARGQVLFLEINWEN